MMKCWLTIVFVSLFVNLSAPAAVVFDGVEVARYEITENHEGQIEVLSNHQEIDFGKVRHKETKVKFINFMNKTAYPLKYKGAAFVGDGFGYAMEDLELAPGQSTSIKCSFFANPGSSVGRKRGYADIHYFLERAGFKETFSIKMKARVTE
ncbi:hypothetical protein B9G69_003760 [Bdellovibrio sp. SKB1291214]|uniref:hypothetical protein n=1 Tax=Bdellovibrio sp. SKB1291214 TaxID=1732569 RepID=UPI000B51CAEE|nr:hypothetical protein [Bdellovibrio sp. SKB1291214]UYL09689.1 hypothetical protein B9G69_003760 [Bdellovibrio sp. SKB1291214]